MKIEIFGWVITAEKKREPEKAALLGQTLLVPALKSTESEDAPQYDGGVIPGYIVEEGIVDSAFDSVEEMEYQEEQNWLNRRKQHHGNI